MDPREKAEPYTMKIRPVIFAQNSHGMAKDYFMVFPAFLLLRLLLPLIWLAVSLVVLLDKRWDK